ncbi:MAG: rRNA biogenesis protein rrp5 [Coriobacteriales bacterium]|jgi:hypothetical protein|nr:rRNA biogenesis protein rrp5 [Coriobacteriales bacterium]
MSRTELLEELATNLSRVRDILAGLDAPVGDGGKSTPLAETKPPQDAKAVSLEEVRGVLAEKSRDGYTAEVRELLLKHGAGKLSEINPERYEALLADAEVLGNG